MAKFTNVQQAFIHLLFHNLKLYIHLSFKHNFLVCSGWDHQCCSKRQTVQIFFVWSPWLLWQFSDSVVACPFHAQIAKFMVLSAPDWPHVGRMNLAIRVSCPVPDFGRNYWVWNDWLESRKLLFDMVPISWIFKSIKYQHPYCMTWRVCSTFTK